MARPLKGFPRASFLFSQLSCIGLSVVYMYVYAAQYSRQKLVLSEEVCTWAWVPSRPPARSSCPWGGGSPDPNKYLHLLFRVELVQGEFYNLCCMHTCLVTKHLIILLISFIYHLRLQIIITIFSKKVVFKFLNTINSNKKKIMIGKGWKSHLHPILFPRSLSL